MNGHDSLQKTFNEFKKGKETTVRFTFQDFEATNFEKKIEILSFLHQGVSGVSGRRGLWVVGMNTTG